MSNTLLTPSVIARESLMLLQANLVAANLVYRDHAIQFAGAKAGDTITIRKPASFVAKEFSGSVIVQDGIETGIPLQLEKHLDVTFAVTSSELSLSLDDFSKQLLQPAIVALADEVDSYLLSKYAEIPYHVGTAGSPPDVLGDLALVDEQLNNNKAPMQGRSALVNPAAKVKLMGIDAVVHADKRGDGGQALRDSSIGKVMGLEWHMGQNIKSHTAGTFAAGSPTVNGAVLAGATSMNLDGGLGAETIKKGDIFTVAGTSGQYVFTADATAVGGAITSAAFYPAAPTGGFANDSSITIVASHAANLAFHSNAIGLAVVPLELPAGAARAEYLEHNGMAIRVVYDYDSSTKTDTVSLDLLVGAKVIQPELACRILG